MRRQNLALVLGEVARHGPVSRGRLAEITGLTRAAVGSLAAELATAGLVEEAGPAPMGRAGRPGALLSVSGSGPAGLGLEVGVDHLAACLVDLRGEIRALARVEVDNRGRPAEDVLAELASVALRVAGEGRAAGLDPVGGVLAVPGLRDASGVVEHAPNLGWHDVAPLPCLGERLGVPVEVENEANLGALAELWQGAGTPDFVHVSADAGIGAALVVGGRLLRGARGYAGELGHVPVHPEGPHCSCGARGCLETYAGTAAVLAAAAEAPGPDPVARLARLAEGGRGEVIEALAGAGRALGIALAGTVNLVDPAAVVLGGAYADLGRWLVPAMRAELEARVTVRPWAPGTLEVSRYGRLGPVLGAALTTTRRIIEDPWSFGSRPPLPPA
jgi:predicted NBD/HSP70 family sugar kinase